MFWDGTRWVDARPAPRAPRPATRARDWIATGIMAFALIALFYPLHSTSAVVPVVTVSPTAGVPGQVLQVRGSALAPKAVVQLFWDGTSIGTPSTTNGGGSFRARVVVPRNAAPGSHTVSARIQGATGRNLALDSGTETLSATFIVSDPAGAPTSPPSPATPAPTGGAASTNPPPVTPAATAPPPTMAPTVPPVTPAPATPNPPDPTAKPTAANPTPAPADPTPPPPAPNSACDATLTGGSGDRTSALLSLISSVPNGSTICFAPGTHVVNGQVKISNRSDLTFIGPATLTTTITNRSNKSMFQVNNSTAIVFRDLVLNGGRTDPGTYYPTHEYETAFDYHASSGTVNRVTMRAFGGDAVYMGAFGDGATLSHQVTVRDCIIDGTGRMGIAITAGSDMLITGNSFDNVALTVIDLEPNSTSHQTSNVVVSGNTVHQWGLDSTLRPWFFEADTGRANNLTIKDNRFLGSALTVNIGRWMDVRRSNVTITGNTSNIAGKSPFGSGGALMYLWHIDGLTVRNNTQTIAAGHRFADINDSTNVDMP